MQIVFYCWYTRIASPIPHPIQVDPVAKEGISFRRKFLSKVVEILRSPVNLEATVLNSTNATSSPSGTKRDIKTLTACLILSSRSYKKHYFVQRSLKWGSVI